MEKKGREPKIHARGSVFYELERSLALATMAVEKAFEQYVKGRLAISRLSLFPEPRVSNCPPHTSLDIPEIFLLSRPETKLSIILLNLPCALLRTDCYPPGQGKGKRPQES